MSEQKEYNTLGPEPFWCEANYDQQQELWELSKSFGFDTEGAVGVLPPMKHKDKFYWSSIEQCVACLSSDLTLDIKLISISDFRRRIIEAGKSAENG